MKIPEWIGKNRWLAWLIILLPAVQVGVWMADRYPPFAVESEISVTPGPPGGKAYFFAVVRRDLDRECSAQFSRYILDGKRFRHDIGKEPQEMTAAGVRQLDTQMGHNIWKFALDVPPGAAPGKGIFCTDLHYFCNPLHRLSPIPVSMCLPFDILH